MLHPNIIQNWMVLHRSRKRPQLIQVGGAAFVDMKTAEMAKGRMVAIKPWSLCFPDVVDAVWVESVAASPVGGFDPAESGG
ncbi:hypothetical protein BKP42_35820 [Rhodococcus erythropolis]|nr:hypothetical protein BKP42_35820 [Rhodococcus erythropolis]